MFCYLGRASDASIWIGIAQSSRVYVPPYVCRHASVWPLLQQELCVCVCVCFTVLLRLVIIIWLHTSHIAQVRLSLGITLRTIHLNNVACDKELEDYLS